jgi:hypothetical protein
MRGFVYFIAPEALMHREEGDDARLVKIGFTTGKPRSRLSQLQTGSPLPLRLWAYVAGTNELEKALHQAFAPLRSHGEWFFADLKLRAFLQYLADESENGPLVDQGALCVAVGDCILNDATMHDSICDDEWMRSAHPSALARLFPDQWKAFAVETAQ